MISQQPLVSVIIPCHNAAAWIDETLRSLLDQSAAVSLEIIVVDDGSTDGSADIVARVMGDAAKIIRQPQAGASRARTVGTMTAIGKYLQYLDADDVLVPGTLAQRVAALDGDADVAYSDWVRWEQRPDGRFGQGTTEARTLGKDSALEIFLGAWWPPGAVLYRRTLVDRILPWREDLPVIQDARFLFDAAFAGARFVRVPAVGLRYRVHTASLSQ